MLRALSAAWLLLRGVAHALGGWWMIRICFARLPPAAQQAAVQQWACKLLRLWRIGLQVKGQPPVEGPVLLVANHSSWLDIVALHAAGHCRFVAKAEVRRWPLIGVMATGAGTLYIQRASRRDALRVVHQMTAALQGGEVLAVFPEGGTGDGQTLLPFHANLLQAAIAASAPAQPVALQFLDAQTGRPSTAPLYAGNQSLLGSVWRTLHADGLQVIVHYGLPQQAQGRERRAWAQALRDAVQGLKTPFEKP